MWPMLEFIEENKGDPKMAPFTKSLYQGVRGLQQLTLLMVSEGAGNPHFLAAGATDYTRYGIKVMGVLLICSLIGRIFYEQKHSLKIAFVIWMVGALLF